jgi:osmotically-inducible protein OsmY
MLISENHPEQLNQADDGILANIWDALRKDDAIRFMDMGSLSIRVKGGEVYLTGYLPREDNLPLIESAAYSVVGVLAVHNHLRTNEGILADIWDELWKEDAIRSLDMSNISIHIKDGEVYLNGHLAQENNRLLIENIAQSVAGVVSVHNYLIVDGDLIIQVARALARDERTRHFILPVGASHGWISLGGEVPTCELQHVAESVAGEVSNVRGVIALPRVRGENPTKPRQSVQPRIGSVVYREIGAVGVVTQVVIRPDNRLVTHVVIRSSELKDINLVAHENVVPVSAIDLANDESVFLVRNGPYLNAYPAFDPDEYPLAPFTWKAPYPYTAGEVLWPFQEILATPRAEIKPGTEIQGALEQVMAHGSA